MSGAALLTVVATVLSVEGRTATIGKGRTDGLRPGDVGRVYYTLYVGEEKTPRRIDVGEASVVEAEDSSAVLALAADLKVRAGYSVELRIPRDRRMVRVAGGAYTVGADLGEARFYNQHPRFRVELETYWIDLVPVRNETGGHATGVTFDDARQYCRGLGKRLPSEHEWEVAVRDAGIPGGSAIHEWTASWYEPYPGNSFPEEEYGKAFRVLRGGVDAAELDPRTRNYMAPAVKRPDVGFRCAWSEAD